MQNKSKSILIGLLVALAGIAVIYILVFSSTTTFSGVANTQVYSSDLTISEHIISVDQANQMWNDGAFLLDVRTVEEWNEVHIPGAFLIPLGELQARVNELPQNQDLVIYCRSGNRSEQALNLLQSAGFNNGYSMAGGIQDWINAAYPVERTTSD